MRLNSVDGRSFLTISILFCILVNGTGKTGNIAYTQFHIGQQMCLFFYRHRMAKIIQIQLFEIPAHFINRHIKQPAASQHGSRLTGVFQMYIPMFTFTPVTANYARLVVEISHSAKHSFVRVFINKGKHEEKLKLHITTPQRYEFIYLFLPKNYKW